MKTLTKTQFRYCKLIIACAFSFILGCMLTINIVPINKTCQIDNVDREYNIMQNSKLPDPDIIILIMSAPHNLHRRTAIRETWLKLNNENSNSKKVRHYFVLGSIDLKADDILHLSTEQSRFNDLLILPMLDNYNNLTHKVLTSFQWLYEQLDVGLNFKYVLKSDDDSFIRIDNLIHEIEQIEIIFLKSNTLITDKDSPYIRIHAQSNNYTSPNWQLYWGYFNGKAEIKSSGKWKEENWMLCDTYLPYALGGGYILSKGLIVLLAKSAGYLKYYSSEDVSVGSWLSSVNNLLRIHDTRFDTEWTSRGCQNYHLISHNLSVKEMETIHKNIIKTGKMCKIGTLKRRPYLYNWEVPPSKCCNKRKR